MSNDSEMVRAEDDDHSSADEVVVVVARLKIPLDEDGKGPSLSARVWLPSSAADEVVKVPVVVEAHPYRAGDLSLDWDHGKYNAIAARGYACVRLDIRGAGDSQGFMADEYSRSEQADLLQVLRFLKNVSWSNGKIAVVGISWAGFAALQAAFNQGSEDLVSACIAIGFTDDRYATDIHFLGGAMLVENVTWSSTMLNLLPAPPILTKDMDDEKKWREAAIARAGHAEPPIAEWLRHQRRDDFWKNGSICEDYSAIKTPTMLVGGLADLYIDPVFRCINKMDRNTLVSAIVGPWTHVWPMTGFPGPAMDFIPFLVRFLDHYLKDSPAIDLGPRVQVYEQERGLFYAPMQASRNGRWFGADGIPSGDTAKSALFQVTADGVIEHGESRTTAMALGTLKSSVIAGIRSTWTAHQFWTFIAPEGESFPQSGLSFMSGPLNEDFPIVGPIKLTVTLSSDQPIGQLIALLHDVGDSDASLITWGALNLSYRDDAKFSEPEPLPVGEPVTFSFLLKATTHVIRKSFKFRLTLENAFFPVLWPTPIIPTFTIHDVRISLPIRDFGSDEGLSVSLSEKPIELAKTPGLTVISPAEESTRTATCMDGVWRFTIATPGSKRLVEDDGWTFSTWSTETFIARSNDPTSCAVEVSRGSDFGTLDGRVGWKTSVRHDFGCDMDTFWVSGGLEVEDNARAVVSREFKKTVVERDFC